MSIQYSVVIPAYNAADTIAEAVASAVSQSLPPEEIIVVDDGSADDTAAIVRRLPGPVQLVQQRNRGPGAATTLGFSAARTAWLATLDADDLWLPDKLERQARYLGLHPTVKGVFSLARLFQARSDMPADTAPQRLWTRTTMVIQTAAARGVGEVIDPPGGRGDMVDWIARCRELGHELHMLDEVLAMRRIRPGSLSYGRDQARDAGYLHVARRALQRKRQATVGSEKGMPS